MTDATCRPDALIRKGTGPYAGEDIFNTTGTGQTRKARAQRGRTRTFTILSENDGDHTEAFTVRGPGSTKRFRVRYFTFTTAELGVDRATALTVKITQRSRARIGSTRSVQYHDHVHS